MKKFTSVLVVLSLALAAPLARADENETKAKTLYKSGVAHYQKGEYRAAVKDLKAADELVQSPALAFNIAQSYRLLGDCKEALAWYRTYLERDPLAPNKDVVNEHIAKMIKCLPKKEEPPLPPPPEPARTEPAPEAKPEAPPPAPIPTTAAPSTHPTPPPKVAVTPPPPPPAPEPTPPPEPAPAPAPTAVAPPPPETETPTQAIVPPPAETAARDEDPGRGKRVTGLVLMGVGAGALVAGVIFGLQARSAADDVSTLSKTGGTWTPEFADKESAGQRDQTLSTIGFGVGAAAVIGGGILYFLGAGERAERPSTTVQVGSLPGGGNVVMTWKY